MLLLIISCLIAFVIMFTAYIIHTGKRIVSGKPIWDDELDELIQAYYKKEKHTKKTRS